ncbi:MAG: 3-oxoacyl-[acyl-carrier-protein] synthase III C-terminal domain-containing protein [Omnitrophica WOR_2 bacterium]
MDMTEQKTEVQGSFYDRSGVLKDEIHVGKGIPFGLEIISNPELHIGGVYGAWGTSYDNHSIRGWVERRLGRSLTDDECMNLSELGFSYRHHIDSITEEENHELEVEVGARLLKEAAHANGWDPSQVEAVLIGNTAPVSENYTQEIAKKAGIPDSALKVSIHKACDGAVSGLHLALNPDLSENSHLPFNLAHVLAGKKILVGGIEGLSHLIGLSGDINALQLFGNGAGILGLIPGKTMRFLAGKEQEVYDDEGMLQVKMFYPHSGHRIAGQSMVEVTQAGENEFRIAGLMHEPSNGAPVIMAGLMGMVKLFVRSGVQVVSDAYRSYQDRIKLLDIPGKSIALAVVHHANYKINKLKEKHLLREGIQLNMPWVLSEFGNVSAASAMIAFLRQLSKMNPGDHILIDGFGAGTYYDVLVVELTG